MMKNPTAMNQVIPEPRSRPRTPNAIPLDTWVLVPVFGLSGLIPRKTREPTAAPIVTDQNAAHQPRPNAMGSAPNSMFP